MQRGATSMDTFLIVTIVALLVAAVTFFVTYFWLDKRATSYVQRAQTSASRIIEEAETSRRAAALAAKDEARNLAARKVIEIGREVKEDADRRARKILAPTVQRIAFDSTAENTVTVV